MLYWLHKFDEEASWLDNQTLILWMNQVTGWNKKRSFFTVLIIKLKIIALHVDGDVNQLKFLVHEVLKVIFKWNYYSMLYVTFCMQFESLKYFYAWPCAKLIG